MVSRPTTQPSTTQSHDPRQSFTVFMELTFWDGFLIFIILKKNKDFPSPRFV